MDRGLGDTVARVTRAVGFKPCGGCGKRREWLNQKIPYRSGGMRKLGDGIPAKLVTDSAATEAGSVFIAPVVLGCPKCGERLVVVDRTFLFNNGLVTLAGAIAFPCGWHGVLLGGNWREVNAR